MEFWASHLECIMEQTELEDFYGLEREKLECLLDAMKLWQYADDINNEFSDTIILWLWDNNDLIQSPAKIDAQFIADVKKYK